MILIQRRHYQKPENYSIAEKHMLDMIEPHIEAINNELRKAGYVGPGRELAIHITSQAEDLRTVILWREGLVK